MVSNYFKQLSKSALLALILSSNQYASSQEINNDFTFNRIATFPVYLNTDISEETVAEIVTASRDGRTLIYTDGKQDKLGFVDIRNPHKPKAAGTIDLSGEPTSVAVARKYALAAVNTSADFISTSGELVVIDIKRKLVKRIIDLGGQPDAVAVSPDGRYAAVAIENERDEDLGDGEIPQAPTGFLVIVDLRGNPKNWTTRTVSLSGLTGMFENSDPEPEYVAINKENIAVVTLQENNHIALVDLKTGNITNHFPAGSTTLNQIDNNENDLIELNTTLENIAREPDGVAWIDNNTFVTADEGDMLGGSRGFTIYNTAGNILHQPGNNVEHAVVQLGHYPEDRSENKGNEPENVASDSYRGEKLLFVGSERASVVLVYNIDNPANPELKQVLPAAVKPEGLLTIPRRGLFIAAAEEDDRGDKIRSAITLYEYTKQAANYPAIISTDRPDGTPIPWGALSGLAADPDNANTLFTIHDSFYNQARIYELDVSAKPAVIVDELVLKDTADLLSAINADMVNSDSIKTVNLDQEGIAVRRSGGFWVASEGNGTVGSSSRPFKTPNLILGVTTAGDIDQVISLPETTNARQVRFGFEGVTSTGTADNEILYVAFQREWADDPNNHVRIGRYDVTNNTWHYFYYPIDTPTSDQGGWVGLSEINALDDETFSVIERDNQAGDDATIKKTYTFTINSLIPSIDTTPGTTPAFPIVNKTLLRDLMPDLKATNGFVLEKIEGMATVGENLYFVNDNDGVDDSNGETQLIKINPLSGN